MFPQLCHGLSAGTGDQLMVIKTTGSGDCMTLCARGGEVRSDGRVKVSHGHMVIYSISLYFHLK